MRSSSESVSETEILFLYCSTRDRIAICWICPRVGSDGAGRRGALLGSKWFDEFLYGAQYDGGGSRLV